MPQIRVAITISFLSFLVSGSGTAQEIYQNPDPPEATTQYHDEVPEHVRSHQPPRDDEEDETSSDTGEACINLFGLQQCAPEEAQIAANLIARGPTDVNIDSAVKPSLVGFVHDRWPVVIDFASQPSTMTVLKVKLYHRRFFFPYRGVAFRQVIDYGGTGGRRIAVLPVVDLPETQSDPANGGVRVAKFAVRSYRLSNGVPELHNGLPVRAPVEIFGIGAGPRAVGSFTLKNVRFGPAQVRIPGQGQPAFIARYSYSLDRDYDVVTATLARCGQVCSEIRRMATWQPAFRAQQLTTGNWPIDYRARPGDYAILIRAWLNCGGAPADQIRTCGDQAAWAFGRAKPVTLRN